MEFRLLGPVEVWAGGQPLDAGQPRQRCVLAALLVNAGQLVTWETLVDRVWGDSPPSDPRHSLYSHVARIRKVLAAAALAADSKPAVVRRQAGGYVIEVDPDSVDLHRFQRLVAEAGGQGCSDARRLALLREALALWVGQPMAGLAGRWVSRIRTTLALQQLDAMLAWARAEQAAGNPAAVIAPLTGLLDEHPLVESVAVALMRALHASGRTALALECYRTTRSRLVEELGVEPGAEIQRLHLSILHGEPCGPAPAPVWKPPAQLPFDVPGFAARRGELAQLDAVLATAHRRPAAVVISALLGTAGVGKTALAVHWAHRVADRFPDGQLYVNLRGFDPSGSAMQPAEALRGFLEALGVAPQRLPSSLEAQAGLYRTLLSGRRVLVILDNARDEDQIRPLLPGSRGSLVVVTSRTRLNGLIATAGAHPLTLDVLTPVEAAEVLAGRLGAARVAAEPDAVEEIITRCAGLPLALAIVAAWAATHPQPPLAALAAELRRTAGSLEAFAGEDPIADVRTVLSWSYRILRPQAARLFRLLSLHPGPDAGAPAAASLLGVPVRDGRSLLAELSGAHLVAEPALGRFVLHDLLRAYADELAQTCDTEREQRSAVHRMLDHYLHTAAAADRRLYPRRDQIELTPPQHARGRERLLGEDDALAWFTAEHPVLVAAVDIAADAGFHTHAWQLAWAMATYLDRHGHWHDWAHTQAVALRAAERGGDQAGQAHACRGLAGALIWFGRYDDARAHLMRAVELFGTIGDIAGQGNTQLDLAWMSERQGRHDDTIDHAERALGRYREAAHLAGQARALNTIGWGHAQLGNHRQALDHCHQALPLHSEIGDRSGEAYTWDSLGYIHHQLGDVHQATRCYRRAVAMFRDIGERYYEADTLGRFGDVQLAAGDRESARTMWRRALEILVQLNHPDADRLRTKISTDG